MGISGKDRMTNEEIFNATQSGVLSSKLKQNMTTGCQRKAPGRLADLGSGTDYVLKNYQKDLGIDPGSWG